MTSHRNSLAPRVVVAGLALLVAGRAEAASSSAPSGSDAPAYPITQREFLTRLDARLMASCASSTTEYNLDRAACRALISQRTASCASSTALPPAIASRVEFRSYGRIYLECAKPYFSAAAWK